MPLCAGLKCEWRECACITASLFFTCPKCAIGIWFYVSQEPNQTHAMYSFRCKLYRTNAKQYLSSEYSTKHYNRILSKLFNKVTEIMCIFFFFCSCWSIVLVAPNQLRRPTTTQKTTKTRTNDFTMKKKNLAKSAKFIQINLIRAP